MAAMPIYGKKKKKKKKKKNQKNQKNQKKKNPKKSSSLEPRKLSGWILIYGIGDSRSTKFVQMMIVDWTLTFFGKVKFASQCICMGKMLKNHFLNCIKD